MPENFKPLQWTDELATGVDVIDKQHKMLINILNDANRCFRDRGDRELQKKVIDDLLSYTVYHFDTEEELMETSGPGDISPDDELKHIHEHRAFTGKAREYQSAVHDGNSIDYESVFSFLNGWLVNHVMGTDKKLGAFLNSK